MKLFRAGFALTIIVSLTGCGATLSKTIRNYGYSDLRPPTILVPPGTVVELIRRDPTIIEIVCSQRASLGDQFKVPESSSYNLALKKAAEKTFGVDADYLVQLKLEVKYASVKNIELTLSNVRIAQLSHDTVYANVAYRKRECQTAIDDAIKNERTVSMITSVLIADVAYSVQFDQNVRLDAENQQEILKGLAAKLGAKYQSTGSHRVTGDGLYWGIRDDAILALLRNDRVVIRHFPKSLEETAETVVFDPTKTAPVITPTSFVTIKVKPQPRAQGD